MIRSIFAWSVVALSLAVPSAAQAQNHKLPGFTLQKQSPSASIWEQGGAGGPLVDCGDEFLRLCNGEAARSCLPRHETQLSGRCREALAKPIPPDPHAPLLCSGSPVCATTVANTTSNIDHTIWAQTAGYRFAYPFQLPQTDANGVAGVAVDSKGNLWAALSNLTPGQPQLLEFDLQHRLIRTVSPDVLGYLYKAHSVAVDDHDNVWVCDENGETVTKVSPSGQVLLTIGVKGKRGDWDEAKGQRLLWQPQNVAVAKNGDIYIAEGHGGESPNDTNSPDPANVLGSARIIHLDAGGRYIGQWYGNAWGTGKFFQAHGVAIDPRDGNVWVADREQYRIVIFTPEGRFIRTLQLRNLPCAMLFTPRGDLWISTGHDGQVLKIDRNGTVLAAIGNGRGTGEGQFMESNYLGMDRSGNLYSGDSTRPRISEMVAPK